MGSRPPLRAPCVRGVRHPPCPLVPVSRGAPVARPLGATSPLQPQRNRFHSQTASFLPPPGAQHGRELLVLLPRAPRMEGRVSGHTGQAQQRTHAVPSSLASFLKGMNVLKTEPKKGTFLETLHSDLQEKLKAKLFPFF